MTATALEVIAEVEQSEATSRKWQPKKWRPEYTKMVALSILGMSNQAISDAIFKETGVRYHFQHVSNVLNTTNGRIIYRHMADNVKKHVEATIPDRLTAIAHKTIERIEEMINDDDLFKKSPFAVIDRGMKVAASTGHIKEESNGSGDRKPAMMMTGEGVKALVEAIQVSDKARSLNKELLPAQIVNVK